MREKDLPFAGDPMLRELHRIRAEHQRATKGLSPAEYANQVEQEARRLLAEHGCVLRPTDEGLEEVCRPSKRQQAA